ncbi:putative quinol monooxygenase [Apilactobacillus micheneri]|uniref:Antibiotic biosynthesis monooxygenase n=1 Tax=Apilactobacillus micheneri TaxID=1899430 RepID=A0A9Q8INK8_9LACO|nr:putative quinol monooxygenase [Apilactobacillus micheneri]TPR40019.1 antibiotic biosynthesis monooxygenase [Apilactobacillus micheneri]TPR41830.1 antibiotic biosynthesis monooxygenase [Apilactobacillus micheneri]TPR44221.1 antibiotic biosynthesis monooxygenase [Apilactobacillus micheneri]TPR45845.1 antibiotic biosynthesis monooxygenase [Apilactobacillus micheneri]TPR50589.1 antibiotic biosynthesis monooxygenase [Apilactobacillus micheneri]
MSITLHLFYTGKNNNAQKFANEMESSGIADQIRNEDGNLSYKYYQPLDSKNTILLIDKWKNQSSLDEHHKSNMMSDISKLREKYDLTMNVEIFQEIDGNSNNNSYIRK